MDSRPCLAVGVGASGATLVLLAVELWVGDPLPLPALGATLFGIVAFWTSRRRYTLLTIAGAVFGAAAGAGFHAASHLAERRLEVAEGLGRHLAADGLVGLGLGLVALLPLLVVLSRGKKSET